MKLNGRRGAFRRRARVMARGSTAVGEVQGAAGALVEGGGVTPMSGDPIEGGRDGTLLAVDPNSGDPIEGGRDGNLVAVDPASADMVARTAVTASRLLGTDGAVRLIRVPAQVLLVQKKGLRAPTAHYVLLGPIAGAP